MELSSPRLSPTPSAASLVNGRKSTLYFGYVSVLHARPSIAQAPGDAAATCGGRLRGKGSQAGANPKVGRQLERGFIECHARRIFGNAVRYRHSRCCGPHRATGDGCASTRKFHGRSAYFSCGQEPHKPEGRLLISPMLLVVSVALSVMLADVVPLARCNTAASHNNQSQQTFDRFWGIFWEEEVNAHTSWYPESAEPSPQQPFSSRSSPHTRLKHPHTVCCDNVAVV